MFNLFEKGQKARPFPNLAEAVHMHPQEDPPDSAEAACASARSGACQFVRPNLEVILVPSGAKAPDRLYG